MPTEPIVYRDREDGVRFIPRKVAIGDKAGTYQLHPRHVPMGDRQKQKHARYVAHIEDVVTLLRTGLWCLQMVPVDGGSGALIEPEQVAIQENAAVAVDPAIEEMAADLLPGDYTAEEWRVRIALHLRHERDRHIVERKKASAATLSCEACGFDFAAVYGDAGRGFIECHHRKPVAEIREGEPTRLEDLALVCANCHRVLHRKPMVLSVEELKVILSRRGATT